MRGIANMGIILSALIILSFNSNRNDDYKIFGNKTPDQGAGFVVFSVDAVAKVNNNNSRGLDFYYHDSLAYGHPVTIAEKGTKLLLNAPALLLEASAKQTPFLIFPGEKINIKYAGSDSIQMYVQGNQQRTNELNFFRKLVQKTGNIYYAFTVMPYLKKVNTLNNIHAFEKIINTIKNNRLQFLNSFIRQSPVSGSFIKLAVNSIKSAALNDSVLLYYNNRELLNRQNLYKKLIAEKLTAIKNIGFMPYQIYYRSCATLVSIITTNNPNYNTSISNSSDFIKRFDFAEKNFSGDTKDFLMSNTLNVAHDNDIPVSNAYLLKFNTQCANEGYKKIINKKLNEKKTLIYANGLNNLLFVDGKTIQDIRTVISKYKGKMTLLDFWASWCSPCRAEMPYYHVLEKKYEGKNIAFVCISSDTNIDDWLTANKEESLGKDNSFLLLNSVKSQFVKRYNINTIPRYILIGKDGKIINDDAPRPSDPKLKELIDKNL